MNALRVNRERLWDSLMQMAEIGATENGGSCRLALSDEDKLGRDLFIDWCKEAGCSIEIDRMGNIFATRAGRSNQLPVATGSHLDTQPTGGKFDGAFGVLSGVEVLRSLAGLPPTLRAIEVVAHPGQNIDKRDLRCAGLQPFLLRIDVGARQILLLYGLEHHAHG